LWANGAVIGLVKLALVNKIVGVKQVNEGVPAGVMVAIGGAIF
jgi:hypothetical protein